MISNCGHDERNKYSGGVAGDQTKQEWAIINWYNRPWNVILRHPDAKVRGEIALLAEMAAKNDLIGYDQGQRITYWNELVASNYDPSKIKKACEADCSSGVLANVKAAGYRLNISELKNINHNGYTGNQRSILLKAGFKALIDSKYRTSPDYLLRGDILLYEGHHTATNLTNGKNTVQENSIVSKKSGWQKEPDGTKFYLGDTGQPVRNNWYQDGGKWYWFDGSGKMVTNTWYQYKGKWYYLGENGAMVKGLLNNDGKWYYLDIEGRMAIDPVVLTPDQNGALQYPGLI